LIYSGLKICKSSRAHVRLLQGTLNKYSTG
jgi:hypothetical protein